ncbi:VCBS repeat-containing protein [Hymenobacter sp. BRD128]|uniref:FG-GAP-like repeat-containing protein n=1 Tax=Hymenobacter sp. BRD128 TaxID=2675878 RepID=UPI001563515B|nr:FG-GAP-like repeat-containing protein [Hymenobacter sp. BRD128]QKG55827.1 VCBS repeat-containing protein [Hymenobacter sp. BRD128]
MSKLSTLLALALLSTGPVAMAQAPVVTAVFPAANSLGNDTGGSAVVIFDRALNAGSASALKVFSSQRGGLLTASRPATVVSNSLTYSASGRNYRYGETITAVLTTAAQSSSGTPLATPRVWQFTTLTAPGTGSFGAKTDYMTGAGAYGVALGDVNNDGQLDMVVANYGVGSIIGNTVSVLLGAGAGSFGAKTDFAVGNSPIAVALGDVNNDGQLDIVTANASGSSLSVLLGTGTGSFGARSDIFVSSAPFGVALGDLNGDGNLDVVTGMPNGNQVLYLLGDGTGNLNTQRNYLTTGGSPYDVALGDLNNDGRLDIVTANNTFGGGNAVSVLLNGPNLQFSPKADYSTGSSANSVALGDVTGDGNLDIVVAGSNTGLSVLRGSSTGSFTLLTSYTGDGSYVRLGDVNGDGNLDAVSVSIGLNRASVRLGAGNGSFGTIASFATGANPYGLALGDLNNDGRLDIATANNAASTASVLLGQAGPPTLTALSPRLATPGTALTLTGTNLMGTTAVTFTGAAGQKVVTSGFTVNAAGTQITGVVVPPGAQSGPVTVTTGSGSSAGSMGGVFWRASVVAVENNHSVAVRADGTLWAWGWNNYGQAGANGSANVLVPTQLGTGTNWVSVAAGAYHNLALRADGTIWAWGLNNGGQLGNGNSGVYVAQPNPTQVGTGTNWVSVAAAYNYSAAIRADGTMWNWGLITIPGAGQTNNITQIITPNPTQVGTATNWVTVTCGTSHMAAVQADGTLWTWGYNGAGALGNGTQNNAQVPTQVGTATNWVSATAGNDYTAAVQADGTLWVWGNNNSGQVGDGTFANQRLSPVRIGTGTAWMSAVAGAYRTLAVQAGGTLWAWGNNGSGQVGDGTTTQRTSPVQVGSATNWVSAALGHGNHSLAEQSCHSLWAWGDNTYGEVGDGTTTQRNSPVQVYNPVSQLSSLTPSSAAAGTTVAVTGTNLAGITALTVNGASALASVTNNTNGGFSFVVPAGATPGLGTVTVAAGCNTASAAFTVLAVPSLASLSPASGQVGSTIAINGSNLTSTTTITFAGSSGNTVTTGFAVNAAGTQITGVVVPSGATTGNVTVTTPSAISNGLAFTITYPDLTVSTGTNASPTTVAGGTYNSITVTGNGVAQLTGSTTVNSAVTVSGTLLTNCQPLTGAASFTVAAGATLGICDPAGLSSAAGTGAVQTTGPRSFSAAASYLYNGTAAQATGNALPSQVMNLTISNPQTVTLTQPVQVKQVLTLASAGNLDLNGQALTLLSDASGTALVVNSGSGVVQGRTGTMQRYLDASGNLGSSGYRHYSAPVTGSTVGDLATGTFTPTLNTQYNSSTTPTAVTPFPTMFGYDETRLASSPATTLSAFDRGWYSPASLSDALAVGRGYTVELGNNELVDFTGTFTTGPQTLGGLTRGTDADAGWHLVGNPYPAPLDWGTVAGSQFTGVLPAIYIYQSTGPYVGRYRSLVNGIGAGTGLIPAGQGFFVRASTAGATGSIALTNANRATTFAGQPALQRTAADLRPRLRLSLGAGSLPASPATALDETFVYLEAGATAAFDGAFDACKLANPSGYYLASASTDAPAQPLSINGRAPLGPAEEVVPLWLSVPTGGTYTLTATELANFTTSAGAATLYLRDALTGTLTNLSQQASYSFAVAAGAPAAGRFALLLRPAGPLATAPALAGALVSLYPNPAAAETTLSATGLPGLATTLDAVLLDAVGRQVGHYTLPVRQGAASQPLPTAGLTSGLYLLRVSVRDARAQPLAQLPTQRLNIR